jgi:hypothetical protein
VQITSLLRLASAVLSEICDAISPGRVELLAKAVLLVAGMDIPESDRVAILERVVGGTKIASKPE